MKKKSTSHSETFEITKASGDKQVFDFQKVERSLRRCGADTQLVQNVIAELKEQFPFTKAHEVYDSVYGILQELGALGVAGRYNLKNALRQLGPTGYPFEKFVGEVFTRQGYQIQLNVMGQGYCIEHELDLVLIQGKKHIMVEAKFHQRAGLKSDVKVSLYVKARFDDMEKKWRQDHQDTSEFHEAWIVTNTRFTSQARDFGNCVGMKMISWSTPKDMSLSTLIDKNKIHPITVLSSLTLTQKRKLIKQGLIICSQIQGKEHELAKAGLKQHEIKQVMEESVAVCEIG